MAETKKYLLELDEAHIKAILPALDLAARLHIGQLGMVSEYLVFNVNTPNKVNHFNDAVTSHLEAIKKIFFQEGSLNAGYGINNPAVAETARLILDVHDVLRHRIAWDEAGNPPQRTKEMMQVYYDKVYQLADSVELPTVVRKDE